MTNLNLIIIDVKQVLTFGNTTSSNNNRCNITVKDIIYFNTQNISYYKVMLE